MNIYYVYEWIRLDTNEPFYVGKGKDNRWKRLDREYNPHFMNIINKIPIAVNILHDNLTEEIANQIECWYIWQYRDIIGYELVNICDGGEGCVIPNRKISEEQKKNISKSMRGKSKDDKHKENLSKSLLGRKHSESHNKKVKENHANFNGKNNPRAKSVICITTKRIFYTAKEGGEYYKCNYGHISACCKGKRKSCGVYKEQRLVWRYLRWNHNKKYRII